MEPIYLNNAATSWPKAPMVGDAVAASISMLPRHAGRSSFSGADMAEQCRSLLANLMQIKDGNRIILGPNATHALNLALHGSRLQSGAVVVTTAAEHNSVLRPLHYLSKVRGIVVHIVPVDNMGRVSLGEWKKAIAKYEPQLAVFTHASNVTGAIQPVEELARIAKQAGAVTLLDASQSLGLVPVLPEVWGIDMVAFTGHKYLLGPPGTGGLYVAPNLDLECVWVGGTGVQSDLSEMPLDLPIRFEPGTPNEPMLAGLATALAWSAEHKLDTVSLFKKVERLALGLAEKGGQVIEADSPRTPVVSFTLDNLSAEDMGDFLYQSFGIVCRTGLHCAPLIHEYLGTAGEGTVRLSLSRFTEDAEIEYCIKAVGDILHETL